MSELNIIHTSQQPHLLAEQLLQGIGGFPKSDLDLFLDGYSELCRVCDKADHVLEICGGSGKLAAHLAKQFPKVKVTGLDLYVPDHDDMPRWKNEIPNLEFVAGTAFDLSAFADESLDMIWGQAALHHLAHDLTGISKESLRVLKPGGKLIFIFEPLGHNLFVAAVRAMRMARHELGDESNLYFSQFRGMLEQGFSSCDVHVFNLLGYLAKSLPDSATAIHQAIKTTDAYLFRQFPAWRRYAANGNLILTK